MKTKLLIILLVIFGFISCNNDAEHKTVICIPVYGQSLALGVEADRITDFDSLANYADGRIVTENMDHHFGYFDLNAFKQFAKKLLRHQNRSFELSVYSMAEWLADHTGKDTLICIFPGGQDGTIIANLGKGSAPYQKFLNDIETAYNSANNKGWSFEMPALCWMQGETDINSYPETNYRELFLKFSKDINDDVKRITGQKKNVEIICYQANALTRAPYFNALSYNCSETEVPQAQMELIRDHPSFHASGPTYPYDCVNEIIHIDGRGQMMHGFYAALAAHDILTNLKRLRGLVPLKVFHRDKEIIVELNVPYPPLRFDTTQVAKAANYGFSVITPGNQNIIQDVSLQDNSVRIICSESTKDCRVRYAVNGDYMKSGRLHGPRGNLRDSQGDSLILSIHGKDYPIHNWCYQFDMSIQQASAK